MKWWLMSLSGIFLIAIVVNSYVYVRSNSALRDAQNRLTSVENSFTAIKGQVPALQSLTPSQQTASPGSASMTDTVATLTPVVVRIDVSSPSTQAEGSGIIISNQGLVLTAQHVVDQATSIQVTLSNGQQYSATVVNSDQTRDVAVIKMNTTRSDLPVATLGSSANVVVGEDVATVGFPLGSQLSGPATFTKGIVSALARAAGGPQRHDRGDLPSSLD